MKSYRTTELQDRLTERLAATEYAPGRTFAGKWWGRGDVAERFYFGDSATLRKNGKPIRSRVWLEFDDPATLEGVSLRVEAPKPWLRGALADWHAPATILAIELIDPAEAARLRAEIEAAREAGELIGDLVAGEEENA